MGNNSIVIKKSFEERMKERIKDSIGELMTDEELSKIVYRTTEDIFFKPVQLKKGYNIIEEPPFIHNLIKDLLKKQVQDAVGDYIFNNQKKVQEQINKTITLGMGKALMDAIALKFNGDLITFQNNLMMNIQSS